MNIGSWLNNGMIENFNLIANSGTFENFNIIEHKKEGKIEDKGFLPEGLINDFSSENYTPFSIKDFSQQGFSS